MRINQIRIRAYPSHQDTVRGRTAPMKTFVTGTALKITMILDVVTATSTITIDDPGLNAMVNNSAMTKEADYIYSYVYQTPNTALSSGDWIITLKAVSGSETLITQDRFTLLNQD